MSTQPTGLPVTPVDRSAPLIIVCPVCQKPTDSMKRLRVLTMIFLVLIIQGRGVDYTSCPSCMRRFILKRTLVNIVTANLIYPIVLISHVTQLLRTFTPGPSESIKKEFGRA
jgi:hypothetical protein